MSRASRIALGIAILCLLGAYAAFTIYESRFYLAKIPAVLKTDGVVRISGNSVCGAAIFELSEESKNLILRQGLGFFDHARQGRGRKDVYHSYEPWRESPLDDQPSSRLGLRNIDEPPSSHSGLRMLEASLICASLSRSLEAKIADAIKHPRTYLTTAREKALLVAPDAQLVVLAYWD
jgi:hypothetical protein